MIGLFLGVVCCLGQNAVWAQPATLVSSTKSVPKLPLWGQFRGDAFGHAMASGLPSKFGPENIRWKTRLPGRGASTPIVVGDRVFLTAYSGFGLSADAPGKPSDLRHHVICLDAATGALVWQQTIRGNQAISPRVSQNLAMHGFASSTPVSDGQRVFAFFGVSGVFAFDINGEYLWQQDVGWRDDNFGSSASLLVDGQRLIVNASVESDTVYALDTTTGQGVWKINDVLRSWSTPVIGVSAAGRRELVINQKDVVRGFDPTTGVELWSCQGIEDYIVPVPVVVDDVVYFNGGKENRTVAVRLGGQGDVSRTHRLWEARFGSNVGSPVAGGEFIFNVADQGIVQCYEASSGKVVKRQRIRGAGVVHASPTLLESLVDGQPDHLLVPLPQAGVAVLEATPELAFVGYCDFETDEKATDFRASLAPWQDHWITRNDEYCYSLTADTIESQRINHLQLDSFQQAMVESRPKFDFDAQVNRIRIYNRCLSADPENLVTFILYPYQSVLSDEQKSAFRDVVLQWHDQFELLRKRRTELVWQGLLLDHPPAWNQAMSDLEAEVMDTQRRLRNVIKKQFTPDQMAAHLKEVQALQRK